MDIKILTDNPGSWIMPYVEKLKVLLSDYKVSHIYSTEDMQPGDVMFILSCEKIIGSEALRKHKHNVVIHPSDLPEGRGWSPLAWQVVEGRKIIVFTAFEATEKVDAGDVYIKDTLVLRGDELNEEIKHLQGMMTIKMVMDFLIKHPKAIPQRPGGTYYKKRTREHSRLDASKTIADQFDLLRVVDNERYPAYFEHKDKTYILSIYESLPDR